jgi:hypothetical protein
LPLVVGSGVADDEVRQFDAAFAKDPEKAWGELIDKLLASPRYGERWAQHWLDVVRYADTAGYSNDYERSNAWRYRDYVVRSFNADKPYDRFVIEQLAGDELADESVRKRGADPNKVRTTGEYTQEEAEWLVATGLLRMGPWDNAMTPSPEARQIYLDDVVNSVGQTFLGTAMRCCKCHDHKFDPLPTRDYYRLYAAFAGTPIAERPVAFVKAENRTGFADGRAFVERMRTFATDEKNKLYDKRETAAKKWYAEHGLKYQTEEERKNVADDKKPPRHPDPLLEVFNQPTPNDSCECRDVAPVAPQAFTPFNSEATSDRSVAFAVRLLKEPGSTGERIDRAFRLAFGRRASDAERTRLTKCHDDMVTYHQTAKPKKPEHPTTLTRSLVEEFSGKAFEYVEILPRFENYTPDTKPADVPADTRALADVCLLLFNANEFAYVR